MQGLFIGCLITYAFFVPYAMRVLTPMITDSKKSKCHLSQEVSMLLTWWLTTIAFVPEARLPVAMFGAPFLPISLFWFGWTSTASIHWIVPIIGSGFFSVGTFLLFQAGLK